jgi:hypothetical protein
MTTLRKNIVAIMLLSFAVIVFSPLPVLSDVIVSIEPPLLPPIVGSSFDVSINISGVADLYAFQFDVSFAPTILSAASVAEGAFLPTGGSTLFFPGTIDSGGSITFTADTLTGAIPGVNGDGTLAVLTFLALASGQSTISLSTFLLLDSNLSDISGTGIGGSVTVSPATGTPVPEPTTFLLVSAGIAAIGILRKKGRK